MSVSDPSTNARRSEAGLEALRTAVQKMRFLIAAAGATDEEIVAEFKRVRQDRQKLRKRDKDHG